LNIEGGHDRIAPMRWPMAHTTSYTIDVRVLKMGPIAPHVTHRKHM